MIDIHRTNMERNSNMELLRILAMLLVLVLHANFMSIGIPSSEEISVSPLFSFFRFFCESLSIICVNVFILISGWFGIQPRLLRLSELGFQTLFLGSFIYIILKLFGHVDTWGFDEWVRLFTFRRGIWFVNAYIVLYAFAPILNCFSEYADRQTYKKVLIAFFLLQTFFGFVKSEEFFSSGFSPLSFMGLYLLARYAKLYPNKYTNMWTLHKGFIFLCASLLTTIFAMAIVSYTGQGGWTFYHYSSPLVILSSFYFFLLFTEKQFKNKVVNWTAASAFAVYLIHSDPLLFDTYYTDTIRAWYTNDYISVFFVKTFVFILIVFAISIIVDKIRICVWKTIENICKGGNKN